MEIIGGILLITGLTGLFFLAFTSILCCSKPGTKMFKLYCDFFVQDEVKIWKKCIANANHFIQTYKSDDNAEYWFDGIINGKYYHILIFSNKLEYKAGVFDKNDNCIACSFCKDYSDKMIKLLLEK